MSVPLSIPSSISKITRYALFSAFGLTFLWAPLYGTSEAGFFLWMSHYPDQLFFSKLLNLAAFALACALVVLKSKKGRMQRVTDRQMIAASSCYLLGILCGILCGMHVLDFWALLLGAFLRGIAALQIQIGWLQVFARQENREVSHIGILLALGLYALVGFVLWIPLEARPLLACLVGPASPVVACLCYIRLSAELKGREVILPRRSERALPSRSRLTLYAANLVYGLAFGAVLFYFATFTSKDSVVVFLLTALLVALILLVRRGRIRLSEVFRVFFLITATVSIFVTLTEAYSQNIGLLFSSAVLCIMIFYTISIFIDVEMHSAKQDWSILGICLLCSSGGIMLSSSLVYLTGVDNLHGSSVLLIAMAGISIVSIVFIPNTSSQTSAWGFSSLIPRESPEKRRLRRCGEIAIEYGLTSRELEILQLLSSGNTKNQIAESLFISPHTAKTHIHNLYTKMGIHGVGELQALIELPTSTAESSTVPEATSSGRQESR